MKPISIKIDKSLPQQVREGWVKAFQEHCFSKGIEWSNYGDIVQFTDRAGYAVKNTTGGIFLFTSDLGDPDRESFTLSTQQDFEAFKEYLDKYIAHYSKPEPKVGEYAVFSWCGEVQAKITEIISSTESQPELHVRTDFNIETAISWDRFIRYMTQEEITKFKNDQLLAEAERRYPAGTKFINPQDTTHIITSTGYIQKELCGGNVMIDAEARIYFVYYQGKWAEIIEPEKEEKKENEYDITVPLTPVKTQKLKVKVSDQCYAKLLRDRSERIKELEEALRNLLNCFTSEYRSNWPEVKTATKLLNQP